MDDRVSVLEKSFLELNKRMNILEAQLSKHKSSSEYQTNTVSKHMIKLVYPGIFGRINEPTAGFPSNRKKVALQLAKGQFMFLYVTSPEKKIIGLTTVASECKRVDGRWPYSVDLEWVINPKPGVTLAEVGLDIRPRVGDTLFSITDDKAHQIIAALHSQDDLDSNTLKYLFEKYKDFYD
ncbi:hypothetical protein B1A99_07630 [Cohnella sp. CIP 111063]|uniref:hypothetical protein n=1 Tax=unclassified Cohnella TaxID=2636738 RepID=UPI000B8BC09E|nr:MULTISPECIES: hypothetical protein [unclassified Cohnella]OXS60303.1 hypothetical protein B1A99_07630 [Cohnella sp. CIP 111063]PRX72987.1 hypothetical protein B0G52_10478 [Cohnella sp. SGD-V74]